MTESDLKDNATGAAAIWHTFKTTLQECAPSFSPIFLFDVKENAKVQ